MHTSDNDREKRCKQARTLYELAMAFREEDWEVFVYDEKHDLLRFPEDERFAFSMKWADIELLQKLGYCGWDG